MKRREFLSSGACITLALLSKPVQASSMGVVFNVRKFGAKGDGSILDTDAVNRAIAVAAKSGGGYVEFPSGRYRTFSIHLRSHVSLRFAPGAVLVAATPEFDRQDGPRYDLPEPQISSIESYQDYGHNHWHNSLLWGENLEDIEISGPGEIWGQGLNKGDGAAEEKPGAGNKCIALKNCRNVILRNLSLREAGHFGVLASGVDNLVIENLRIDTRRDGIDIDSCRDVHIRGCTVNAPWDDAIVLKSSYSLGKVRPTERVTISDCIVTGKFQAGSMLDGTYQAFPPYVPVDQPSFIGRIKIGTETNGDIRDVTVTNCVLEGCHGLAVESEDGGNVENILFNNIVLRDMVGPPIFVRLGGRLRGPAGTAPGTIRNVAFRQIECDGSSGQACSIIAGIPGHPVQNVTITDVHIRYAGGGTLRQDHIPEQIAVYPDPEMFGATPAQGVYIRHAKKIELRNIELTADKPDPRPLVWLEDAQRVIVRDVAAKGSADVLHFDENSTYNVSSSN
jgi:polygalacturonase